MGDYGRSEDRKVALITGSASGIGANIAIDLASIGYHVILTGRDAEKLDKVSQRCKFSDIFLADLFDLEQVDRLIKFISDRFNRLDLLVNNACWRGPVQDIADTGALEELEKVMHINVTIPIYLVHKCLLPMKPKDQHAVVLNISSTASQKVCPLQSYSIAKACLSELTRQLASLIETHDILSITVSPGPVLTEERPHHKYMGSLSLMERAATTQEISNFALFAISKAHLFNGRELFVDGGVLAKGLKNESYVVQKNLSSSE